MKKYFNILSLIIVSTCFAQVGINKLPATDAILDVEGSTLIDSYLIDEQNHTESSNNYFLAVRSKETTPVGKVKLLDVSLRNVAPVNRYNVIITNVNKDQVVQLNTDLSKDKYVLAIAGAIFKVAVSEGNSDDSFGAYATEVGSKEIGGESFLTVNLDFKGASNTLNDQNGTWEITLVVYERALVKDWGTFTGSVSQGANPQFSGVSQNTPAGLQ